MDRIPLLRPELPETSEWLKLFEESRRSHHLSNFGPCYRTAQEELDRRTHAYSVLVNSGTTALQTALMIHCPGARKIAIPDFTFAATMNAVFLSGKTPVLAPVYKHTWTINMDYLYDYRHRFDAFVVVAPFGYNVDMAEYDKFSRESGKPVVYDFAAAFGGFYRTAHPVCYSFQATKNLPVGEGGAVVFYTPDDRARAQQLINFDFNEDRFCRTPYGFNGKMDEIHSAILLAQLAKDIELDRRIARKKHLIMAYEADLPTIVEPHGLHVGASPQLAVFRTPYADELVLRGAEEGVEFRKYYHPLLSSMGRMTPPVEILGKSEEFFRTIVGFPTDLIGDEYARVVEFVQRVANDKG